MTTSELSNRYPFMVCSLWNFISYRLGSITILAGVQGPYNAVWVKGMFGEDTFYYGWGAGHPTGAPGGFFAHAPVSSSSRTTAARRGAVMHRR